MKTKYKVLIAFVIVVILGLIGFLVWWLFKFRNHQPPFVHRRTKAYRLLVQADVHKRIDENKINSGKRNRVAIPKVVYLTYHDIDMIPPHVIENLKRYCNGYKIEIHGDQSCDDFLYKYYGPDVMQLFRELDQVKRTTFWALCRIYVDGGHYLDIRKEFVGHVSNLPSSNTVNMSHKGRDIVALSSKSKAPELWNLIMNYFPKTKITSQEEHIVNYDDPTQVYSNFPLKFKSSVDELIYRHHNLPDVDPQKLDIPVLYINMDKHKERRKFIEAQLNGVTSVTRVPGVLVTDKKHKPLPPHSVTNGELGCAMAHRNAWQTFMDKDWEKVLILEDDASLKLSSRWRESLSHIQTPAFLGQGATGYILDRSTAEYLLQEFESSTVDAGVDSWMWERLLGKDHGISPENIGYSNSSRRKCHTVYYIYAYNAEEEFPTAIVDRSYGTNVREQYCRLSILLIKRSPKVGVLIIYPTGETRVKIQRPRVALFEVEEDVARNLLNSYDSNYDVHVYTDNADTLVVKSEKVFQKARSNFNPIDFDVVVAPGFTELPNIVILEAPTSTHVVDPRGFPTEKVQNGRTFDFVEIGTSDFDTEVELANDYTLGLSVEPLADYYNRLSSKARCVKENAAISDTAGTLPMYYVPPEIVKKLDLPLWITGSNALGEPHKLVLEELNKRGLPENLFEQVQVPVLTFGQLMEKHKVEGIKYLKIDTEGHDPIVLESMISYCDQHPQVYPTRIQFESNELSDAGREKRVIQSLEERGYKDVTEDKENARDKVMIRDLARDALPSIKKRSSLKVNMKDAKGFCKPDTPGCSQFEQAGILHQIFSHIGTTNKYFVEFGARRPQILNSSYFRMKEGWNGLLLDGSPLGNSPNTGGEQEDSRILLNAKDDDPVRLRQAFFTKDNINIIFAFHRVPQLFDLLTIDIDRNDYHVLKSLNLDRFAPRVIAVEFSSYFNSDEHCVSRYYPKGVWDGKSVSGCSLRALNDLMNVRGYSYVAHASGSHAIFVRNSELSYEDVNKEIPHVIPHGWMYKSRVEKYAPYDASDFQCKPTKEDYTPSE